MPHHVTTFWYVDTSDPSSPFRHGVPSDPGFARRLLSRLHPTTTVASLGAFPLNRSASAGPGEIYIGAFPDLTVVQTPVKHANRLSTIGSPWIGLVDVPVVLAFSHDSDGYITAFARWEDGDLVRAFSGSPDSILEDEGLPQGFELPYWSGEFPLEGFDDDPLALPFAPQALQQAAHRYWLNFDLDPGGLDVPVHGFATDGRREVRPHRRPRGVALHLTAEPGITLNDEGEAGPGASPYVEDEYERPPHDRSPGARDAVESVTHRVRDITDSVVPMVSRQIRRAVKGREDDS